MIDRRRRAWLDRLVEAGRAGDTGVWDVAYRHLARARPHHLEPWDATLVRSAAEGIAAVGEGSLGRAARARQLALSWWMTLGSTEDADLEREALVQLGTRGAAVPLGPFDLTEPIARGSSGVVWRARGPGGVFAVKVVASKRDRPDSLEDELRAVAALDHPGIVGIVDHGRVDAAAAAMNPSLVERTPWLAMPHADGGTLLPLCGAAPWGETRRVLLALLDALAHAHARGVVHLDVKPANVLLFGSERSPRLTDFGLAHAYLGDDPGSAAGTPIYMAPEQFFGDWREYGPWTDLYAVGCLAMMLVSGAPPFVGDSVDDVRYAHLNLPPPRLEPAVPVPIGLGAWIERALSKSPWHRFRRAAEAKRALLDLPPAPGEPIAHLQTVPPPPTASSVPTQIVEPTRGFWSTFEPPTQACDIPEPSLPLSWTEASRPGPPAPIGGLALLPLRTPRLVGRERERSLLWSCLQDVVTRGETRAAVISGTGGIGVSRLASWLAERAHEVGAARILIARHTPAGGPDDGLVPMVERAVRVHRIPTAEERMDRLQARLGARLGADVHALLIGALPQPAGQRHALIAETLRHLARRRPLVVVVDDAQWGLEALAFVRAQLAFSWPVLFVVTVDPGACQGRVGTALDALLDTAGTVPLDLGPLDGADRSGLLQALIPLQSATLLRLAVHAGGVPQLATQLVTHLAEEDRLAPSDRGHVLADDDELPADLMGVWRARLAHALDGLDADQFRTLELAATLGPGFEEDVWRAACVAAEGPSPDEVRARLLDAGMLKARGGRVTFPLERVRLAVLEHADVRLAGLHALCAGVVDDDGARAHHLAGARRYSEAASLFLDHGVALDLQGRLAEGADALDHAANALDLHGAPETDTRRGSIRLRRAIIDGMDGQMAKAIEDLEALRSDAQRLGWTDLHLQALDQLASGRNATGEHDQVRAVAQEALELARRTSNRRAEAIAVFRLAFARARVGGEGPTLDEALALLREHGSEAALAGCLTACARHGPLEQRHAHLQEAQAIYERLGFAVDVAILEVEIGTQAYAAGDLDRAERHFRRALHTPAIGRSPWRVLPLMNVILCDWARGRRDEADRAASGLLDEMDPAFRRMYAIAATFACVPVAAGPDEAFAEAWYRARGLASELDGIDLELDEVLEEAMRRAEEAGLSDRIEVIRTALGDES